MVSKQTKLELLAPAGNLRSLKTAINSGADAVYFAGKQFGARSYADNFTKEEITEGINYCHKYGKKAYVTVNTLINNKELKELSSYIDFLADSESDALIVQDPSLLRLVREKGRSIPLFASTQMTIHNLEGVRQAERLGFKRVILSRELSSENIKYITANTDVQIEIFAHGALCAAYSGQCLMSSFIGGRSGNRGKCAGSCRLPYSINDSRNRAYYLSLKDLSLINHIQKMQDIGVESLKIEGRMKGEDYISGVISIYREYIDNPRSVEKKDVDLLERLFNRGGYTDGYFSGHTGKSMFAPNKPDSPYKYQKTVKGTSKK